VGLDRGWTDGWMGLVVLVGARADNALMGLRSRIEAVADVGE
jgi:hypothetical protein